MLQMLCLSQKQAPKAAVDRNRGLESADIPRIIPYSEGIGRRTPVCTYLWRYEEIGIIKNKFC